MDWLEEQAQRLYRKLTHMSLKKTLAAYIFLAVLGVLGCWLMTWQICEGWEQMLTGGNGRGQLLYIQMADGTMGFARQIEGAVEELPGKVQRALTVVTAVQNCSIFVYTVAAIWLVAWLYYRNKLRQPIAVLTREAEAISRDELDASCAFHSGDEMGSLCNAVEGMRKKLAKRQGQIWEEMEEQRRLNAAFAHDLRTPLTVLQDYVDLLETYYPAGRISQEKMMEILEMMGGQVDRLRRFGDTMKKIHSLEERGAVRRRMRVEELARRLEESAGMLVSGPGEGIDTRPVSGSMENPGARPTPGPMEGSGKLPESGREEYSGRPVKLLFRVSGGKDVEGQMDPELMLEVTDNLISNALRYTGSLVEVVLEADPDTLCVSVRDDGRGFSGEELKMAAQPYYTGEKEQGQHFGIGLYISRMLCQQHGGILTLSNSIRGGAVVCAQFAIGD